MARVETTVFTSACMLECELYFVSCVEILSVLRYFAVIIEQLLDQLLGLTREFKRVKTFGWITRIEVEHSKENVTTPRYAMDQDRLQEKELYVDLSTKVELFKNRPRPKQRSQDHVAGRDSSLVRRVTGPKGHWVRVYG